MKIYKELTTYEDFKEASWCCEPIWKKIESLDLEDIAVDYLNELFSDDPVDETALNDYIRFDLWDDLELDNYDDNEEDNNK